MIDVVIDSRVFDEIAELMDDSLGLFIDTYLENSPKLLASISSALSEGDSEKVMANAHQLKGGSGSIGAMQVFNIAKQMEEKAKDGMLDDLASEFITLKAAFVEVEKELRARKP